MERNLLLYLTDLFMGIVFLVSSGTGLIKFLVLQRIGGLGEMVLPSALISTLHDDAGILLACLVLLHLLLNRHWIAAMTRKIAAGN